MCLTFRAPSPSTIAALSTEEWASCEQYSTSSGAPASPFSRAPGHARSRAAARATSVEVEAVSVIMPNHDVGRPMARAYQPITTCSSSVSAGDVFHTMPFTLSAAVTNSPRMPGPEPVIPK